MSPGTDGAEARVLVIYTGGTIGMVLSGQGYTPEPNLLMASLRTQTRFHDPHGLSLYSNAGSSADYKTWAASNDSSGTSTPVPANVPSGADTAILGVESAEPGLIVRSSRPFSEKQYAGGMSSSGTPFYEKNLPSLITPKSYAAGDINKRIRYVILEWEPLLDSSNMEPSDWIRIAADIELNYHAFDAFVILHGTDTMCYSSSALSFMLEDLGKTVIITGAQIPLSKLRNDAVENLLGALTLAGHYILPECCVYFNHKLYRGNRVSKVSSDDFDAFDSPNFPPLVEVGIGIEVNWTSVLRPRASKVFQAYKHMSPNVATLRLFPGITGSIIRAFLAPPLQGVVLETFGTGNGPGRPDILEAIKEATDRGVVVVAISQCQRGAVSADYQTGRMLIDIGVSPGADMTPECALTKLGYLLSKNLPIEEIRALMGTPLRGELTVQASEPTFSTAPDRVQDVISDILRLSSNRPRPPRRTRTSSADVPMSTASSDHQTEVLALLPFLAQLAVARDDVSSLEACLATENEVLASLSNVTTSPASAIGPRRQARGLVNQLDAASGRSLLHVAALHGSEACVEFLLHSGALVHLRDALDHTALYYAARQQHRSIVLQLRSSGAHLGGADVDGGYAALAFDRACKISDEVAKEIWYSAGYTPQDAS